MRIGRAKPPFERRVACTRVLDAKKSGQNRSRFCPLHYLLAVLLLNRAASNCACLA